MAVTDTEPGLETPEAAARGRGRPQLHADDEVLDAALAAFAEVGYEAMSIRSLGRDLGLSHGALNQRFGSKDKLFYAAVDHGFGGLARSMSDHVTRWPAATGLSGLRYGFRAFLLAAAERPHIMRLMNTLGIAASERLDYVFERHIDPMIEPLREAAATAELTGGASISTRELFFLVAHGAAAAFTLQGLSAHFDSTDGRLDPERYAEHMADALIRILGVPEQGRTRAEGFV
jgi:AcrR family transcriptional regulator